MKKFIRFMSFALGYLVGGNLLLRRHPLAPLRGTRGKPLAALGVASDGSSLSRKFANFDSLSSAKLVRFVTVITFIIFITVIGAGEVGAPASSFAASAGEQAPGFTPGIPGEATIDASLGAVPAAPKEDLTQPGGEAKGRLQLAIENQKLGPLSPTNFLRRGIRSAVDHGVPPNTIVLLLLFPLAAMVIAAARHLLGLRGFGIFTPAVVAVAFLATGLTLGLALFVGLIALATTWRYLIRRMRLQYLPRMALLILFMSAGILAALMAVAKWPGPGAILGLTQLINIGIFPLLLLILLTETFISAQISHGLKRAIHMTIETLVLATISALLMELKHLQVWVLTHPEFTISFLAGANILLGRFAGLRVLEYWRFRELLRK